MKLLRNVNGDDLARHLEKRWGYTHGPAKAEATSSCGTDTPHGHTATVPAHKPLKTGTLQGILKSVAVHKGVSIAALLEEL